MSVQLLSQPQIHLSEQCGERQKRLLQSVIRSYIGQAGRSLVTSLLEEVVAQHYRENSRVKSDIQAILYPHLINTFVSKVSTLFLQTLGSSCDELLRAAQHALIAYTDNGIAFAPTARSQAHFDTHSTSFATLQQQLHDLVQEQKQAIAAELQAVGRQCISELS